MNKREITLTQKNVAPQVSHEYLDNHGINIILDGYAIHSAQLINSQFISSSQYSAPNDRAYDIESLPKQTQKQVSASTEAGN